MPNVIDSMVAKDGKLTRQISREEAETLLRQITQRVNALTIQIPALQDQLAKLTAKKAKLENLIVQLS